MLFFLLLFAIFELGSVCQAQLLGPDDINKLPSTPADKRVYYGTDSQQFGDLRLPTRKGRHLVAVVIHGGCYLSAFADVQNTAALSSALTNAGIATWNIEYRRVDNPGGGSKRRFAAALQLQNCSAARLKKFRRGIKLRHRLRCCRLKRSRAWLTVEGAVKSLLTKK